VDTAFCAPENEHCTMHTGHWTLDTAHRTLETTHCTLHTVTCKLHTAKLLIPCTFGLCAQYQLHFTFHKKVRNPKLEERLTSCTAYNIRHNCVQTIFNTGGMYEASSWVKKLARCTLEKRCTLEIIGRWQVGRMERYAPPIPPCLQYHVQIGTYCCIWDLGLLNIGCIRCS